MTQAVSALRACVRASVCVDARARVRVRVPVIFPQENASLW